MLFQYFCFLSDSPVRVRIAIRVRRLSARRTVTEAAGALGDLLLLDGDDVDGDGVKLEEKESNQRKKRERKGVDGGGRKEDIRRAT